MIVTAVLSIIIRVTFIPYPLYELIKPLASVSEWDLFCVFFQEYFQDNCEQQLHSPLTLTQLTQRKQADVDYSDIG